MILSMNLVFLANIYWLFYLKEDNLPSYSLSPFLFVPNFSGLDSFFLFKLLIDLPGINALLAYKKFFFGRDGSWWGDFDTYFITFLLSRGLVAERSDLSLLIYFFFWLLGYVDDPNLADMIWLI